jgi:hypothetical protein
MVAVNCLKGCNVKVIKFLVAVTAVYCFGYGLCYFTKSEESYKNGFEAGNTETMQKIQKLHGIINMDSAIAKAKQMPSDSLSLIWFNLTATKEERALVKSFILWIKEIKEVKND